MEVHLSSNWNRQSIYLLHVKYLQKCSLLCKHNFSVDPQFFFHQKTPGFNSMSPEVNIFALEKQYFSHHTKRCVHSQHYGNFS